MSRLCWNRLAKNLLALGANAEKLQLVSNGFETIVLGNSLLQFLGKAFINLHNC